MRESRVHGSVVSRLQLEKPDVPVALPHGNLRRRLAADGNGGDLCVAGKEGDAESGLDVPQPHRLVIASRDDNADHKPCVRPSIRVPTSSNQEHCLPQTVERPNWLAT